MSDIAIRQASQATLVEIRSDSKRFPRIYTYKHEEAVAQMNMIIMMAYQYRGQQADAQTIVTMSSSLIEILMADEYNIGTQYLSFEEIKRVIRKAALGQSKEMFGISVYSLFQALADYCKGEGRQADKQAREQIHKQRQLTEAMIAPMLQGYVDELKKRSKV